LLSLSKNRGNAKISKDRIQGKASRRREALESANPLECYGNILCLSP